MTVTHTNFACSQKNFNKVHIDFIEVHTRERTCTYKKQKTFLFLPVMTTMKSIYKKINIFFYVPNT